MKRIIINPGTEGIDDTTVENATANIQALIEDIGLKGIGWNRESAKDYGDGRYAFNLMHEGRTCEVQMPGLELRRVRWMDLPEQNIWHYPRLYIDGNSWVWKYAISSAKDSLEGRED